jgi:hypothetical protein
VSDPKSLWQKDGSEIAKKIEAKRCEMKRKFFFLVSQKQAKMKRNRMRFASFRFEAKIKKERKRDTLYGASLITALGKKGKERFNFF